MAFVQWRDSYSVGFLQIDQQHQRLLALINELHDVMSTGGSPLKVQKVADALLEYTRYHFSYEERLISDAGYPATAEHNEKHKAMTAQVEWFRKELHANRASLPLNLMGFMKNWLSKHILESDMEYSTYLARPVPR